MALDHTQYNKIDSSGNYLNFEEITIICSIIVIGHWYK
jgi:hypothetical protein